MAVVAAGQRQSFEDRIGRIRDGGPNTMGTVYMGANDADGQTIHRKRKGKGKAGRSFGVFMVPLAIIFGGLAMLGGRVGLFHLSAQPDLIPEDYAEMALAWSDLAIGLVLLFVFSVILKLGRGARKYALAMGFAAVMVGEAALIQQAPDLFVPMFSEEYVATAMAGPTILDELPGHIEAAKAYIASTQDG